ncbi:hypothetical protein N203_07345 [Helicobacter pylori UM084]|nr:hypothetical protein N203_07345 [Helicobacter pylori UM084]
MIGTKPIFNRFFKNGLKFQMDFKGVLTPFSSYVQSK